jgi:hypothetical protein
LKQRTKITALSLKKVGKVSIVTVATGQIRQCDSNCECLTKNLRYY